MAYRVGIDTHITGNNSGGFGRLDCNGIRTEVMAFLLGQLIVQFVQILKRERAYMFINKSIFIYKLIYECTPFGFNPNQETEIT